MLALSNPDPSLAFPVGTVLHPQLFIRNTTSKPIDASLAFNWRSDTSSGKSPATILHLSLLKLVASTLPRFKMARPSRKPPDGLLSP